MKMLGDLGWVESYFRGLMAMDGLGLSPLSILHTRW